MAVALIATLTSFAPHAAQPAGAQVGGCLERLEIETPSETATAFGVVTVPAGATFRANVKHWTSAPTALTWINGFNSEVRLSPMRADGFPGYASPSQTRGLAADGPWQSDGYSEDGVFQYTNPANSHQTRFVLEVAYWNRPAEGVTGRTEAYNFTVTPAGGSAAAGCVAAHSIPQSPTGSACGAWPTFVADGPAVHSEPFQMSRNAVLRMTLHDQRPLRFDDAGNVRPLLRSDYLVRVWLYGRSGPGEPWTDIAQDGHISENNWSRPSYLGNQDISLKNRSSYPEVKVIFTKWLSRGYATTTPLDVSMQEPGGVARPFCTSEPMEVEIEVDPQVPLVLDRYGPPSGTYGKTPVANGGMVSGQSSGQPACPSAEALDLSYFRDHAWNGITLSYDVKASDSDIAIFQLTDGQRDIPRKRLEVENDNGQRYVVMRTEYGLPLSVEIEMGLFDDGDYVKCHEFSPKTGPALASPETGKELCLKEISTSDANGDKVDCIIFYDNRTTEALMLYLQLPRATWTDDVRGVLCFVGGLWGPLSQVTSTTCKGIDLSQNDVRVDMLNVLQGIEDGRCAALIRHTGGLTDNYDVVASRGDQSGSVLYNPFCATGSYTRQWQTVSDLLLDTICITNPDQDFHGFLIDGDHDNCADAIAGRLAVLPFPILGFGEPNDSIVYRVVKDGKTQLFGITSDLDSRSAQLGPDSVVQPIVEPWELLSPGEARAIAEAVLVRSPAYVVQSGRFIELSNPYYDRAVEWGELWLQTHGF